MTERENRFVDFYIQTGNASEAARLAGYSAKTAAVIGAENLRKPKIQREIDARLKKLESERTADAQEVLEHLAKVLRGKEVETVVTASGKKFVVPVREIDKLKAADMILKVSGAYREKVEVQMSGAELFIQTLEKIWRDDRASP